VTAIARVNVAGVLLDDAGVQDRKVAGWGRAMAGLCQQPTVAGEAPSVVLASTRST